MKLIVYTAGAISGLNYEGCIKQFNIRIERLRKIGFDVLYPMLGKEHLRNEIALKAEYLDNPISINHAIVQADFWRVDKADILHIDFTNASERVSIGTIAEMSRAFAKNKLIITILSKENIHRHAFIMEMSSIIFEDLEESFKYLEHYRELFNKENNNGIK